MDMPVFIAAGYGEHSIPIDEDEPYKPFVNIRGKPLFGYSLEATLGFTAGKVFVWGDKGRLEEETVSGMVDIPSDDDLERIVFVEQEDNMFDSFLRSFFTYLADVRGPDGERMFEDFEGDPSDPGQVSGYIRRNPLATMHAAMVLPSDAPLLTVREIASFYRKALRLWDKADLFAGMSRKQDLEGFMEHAGVDFTEEDYRNLNMNFMPMLGGDYRINNMWIMKPMRVLERCPQILELLPEVYAKRYQSRAENIRGMADIVREWQSGRGADQAERDRHKKALYYDAAVWLPPIISQMLNRWQKDSRKTVWYSPRMMDHAFTEDFWPARLITTRYPSSMLDVDRPEAKPWIEEHYDKLAQAAASFEPQKTSWERCMVRKALHDNTVIGNAMVPFSFAATAGLAAYRYRKEIAGFVYQRVRSGLKL